MRKTLAITIMLMGLGLLLLITKARAVPDFYPRQAGLDILHYHFYLELSDSTDRITGTAIIRFRRERSMQSLDLDLTNVRPDGKGMQVGSVILSGREAKFTHEADRLHLSLPNPTSSADTMQITVHYSGVPADGLVISKNKFGARCFFGDNWPDRARHWLPCIDHPSDKATVEFTITAPDHYLVVSNGLLCGQHRPVGPRDENNLITHWKSDIPLPTKVMVIGVADFAWELAGNSLNIPVQSWVYKENRESGFTDYRPALEILNYYQQLIGPYSFEKLANVQSKTMFGGMENSGCIFYYEGSVSGKNNIQSLLAHEIAHQWFGDAVTEKDWHHIWISEGFATYLEACFADSLLPGRDLEESMKNMREEVIQYHERTHQPVIDTTITDPMRLLSTNSYQKGAWVLHMLRQEIGEEFFWEGIREFYSRYRDKNADSEDFQLVMELVSGRNLESFFTQWLRIAGQPEISWSWTYDEKNHSIEITVVQNQSNYLFDFDLSIAILAPHQGGQPDNPESKFVSIPIRNARTFISVPIDFQPVNIILDPEIQLLYRDLGRRN